jgi:hypothetical protein
MLKDPSMISTVGYKISVEYLVYGCISAVTNNAAINRWKNKSNSGFNRHLGLNDKLSVETFFHKMVEEITLSCLFPLRK